MCTHLGFGKFLSYCYSDRISQSSSHKCLNFISLGRRKKSLDTNKMTFLWHIQQDKPHLFTLNLSLASGMAFLQEHLEREFPCKNPFYCCLWSSSLSCFKCLATTLVGACPQGEGGYLYYKIIGQGELHYSQEDYLSNEEEANHRVL